MAEEKKESRGHKRYGKPPSIKPVESKGDAEKSATPKAEKTDQTPHADMNKDGGPKPSEDAGTAGIPVHERHASEREAMHHRHMADHHEMHARHMAEHRNHKGDKEEMHTRHETEKRGLHTSHERERRAMHDRHEAEMAPGVAEAGKKAESTAGKSAERDKSEGKGGTEPGKKE